MLLFLFAAVSTCIYVPFRGDYVELCRTNQDQLTTKARNEKHVEYTPFYAKNMEFTDGYLIFQDKEGVHKFTIDNNSNKSLMYSIKEVQKVHLNKNLDQVIVRKGELTFDFNNNSYAIQQDGTLCIEPSSIAIRISLIINFICCLITLVLGKKRLLKIVKNGNSERRFNC